MSGKEEIAETENNNKEISLPDLTRDNVDDEFIELFNASGSPSTVLYI